MTINFQKLVESGGTFTGGQADLDSYIAWLQTTSCMDCGAKYTDRPRDADGKITNLWATEVLCGDCCSKRCREKTVALAKDKQDFKDRLVAWIVDNVDDRDVPMDEGNSDALIWNLVQLVRHGRPYESYDYKAEQDAEVEKLRTAHNT